MKRKEGTFAKAMKRKGQVTYLLRNGIDHSKVGIPELSHYYKPAMKSVSSTNGAPDFVFCTRIKASTFL